MKIYKEGLFVCKPKNMKNMEEKFVDFTNYNSQDLGFIKKIKQFNNKNLIMCAYTTYPDMLPVMLNAKAIICEVGGYLSHSAIVAREFSIPCVVGVKSLKEIITNSKKIGIDFKKEYVYSIDKND
jgi:phosphohistidine swiveling domain-containing protein